MQGELATSLASTVAHLPVNQVEFLPTALNNNNHQAITMNAQKNKCEQLYQAKGNRLACFCLIANYRVCLLKYLT
jgi:hypothetical protein